MMTRCIECNRDMGQHREGCSFSAVPVKVKPAGHVTTTEYEYDDAGRVKTVTVTTTPAVARKDAD